MILRQYRSVILTMEQLYEDIHERRTSWAMKKRRGIEKNFPPIFPSRRNYQSGNNFDTVIEL